MQSPEDRIKALFQDYETRIAPLFAKVEESWNVLKDQLQQYFPTLTYSDLEYLRNKVSMSPNDFMGEAEQLAKKRNGILGN